MSHAIRANLMRKIHCSLSLVNPTCVVRKKTTTQKYLKEVDLKAYNRRDTIRNVTDSDRTVANWLNNELGATRRTEVSSLRLLQADVRSFSPDRSASPHGSLPCRAVVVGMVSTTTNCLRLFSLLYIQLSKSLF